VSAVARAQVFGFEWGFLDEICRWALAVAVLIAVVGVWVTQQPVFAVAVLVVAGVDVAMIMASSRRARRELDAGRIDAVAPIVMLAGRLIVKAGLLVAWLLYGGSAGFAGAVAGAVVFDVTLALIGSGIAVVRGLRSPPGVG
jgi:uncharacterized membrane protein YdfJ with MMPL/SSD domain